MKESSPKKNQGDPKKFSPVNINLEESGETYPYKYKKDGEVLVTNLPIWRDTDGNKFYEKRPEIKSRQQNITVEHFVSLLIKGVLNNSDLIIHQGRYLSKKMDLEKIEEKSPEELKAELFILKYLFEDWDKDTIRKNVRTNGRSYVHFDYGDSFRAHPSVGPFLYINGQNTAKLIQGINDELNHIDEYEKKPKERNLVTAIKNPSKKVEEKLFEKAQLLKEQIKDPVFFMAVIKKSGVDISKDSKRFNFLTAETNEERAQELQKILLERLEILVKTLEARNPRDH